MTVQFPLVAVLGDVGTGKTVTLTALADTYAKAGYNVFTNFTLNGISHTKVTFKEVIEFADHIEGGVLLLDEGHIGMDSKAFWTQLSRDMNKFITQRRKREISMYITTQNFMSLTKSVRTLANYVMECSYLEHTKKSGEVVHVVQLDNRDRDTFELLTTKQYIATPYFDKYDTNEIIEE